MPHISLVFCEMWDTTAFHLWPLSPLRAELTGRLPTYEGYGLSLVHRSSRSIGFTRRGLLNEHKRCPQGLLGPEGSLSFPSNHPFSGAGSSFDRFCFEILCLFDHRATLLYTRGSCLSSQSRWIRSCRSGGIGRRAWFRSMYSQGCGGSSPFFGTNLILQY